MTLSSPAEADRPLPCWWAVSNALQMVDTLASAGIHPDRYVQEADGGVAIYFFAPHCSMKILFDNDQEAYYSFEYRVPSDADGVVVQLFPDRTSSVAVMISTLQAVFSEEVG